MRSRPNISRLVAILLFFVVNSTTSNASAQNCVEEGKLTDRAIANAKAANEQLETCEERETKVILEMRDIQNQRSDCEGRAAAKDDEIERLTLRVVNSEKAAAYLEAKLADRFPTWFRIATWSAAVAFSGLAGFSGGAGLPGAATASLATAAVLSAVFAIVVEF